MNSMQLDMEFYLKRKTHLRVNNILKISRSTSQKNHN
jgi:hypothetical protein